MTATNIKERDTFTRSNTSSTSPPNWGTASNGDSWSFNINSTAYSGNIASNQGKITNGSALCQMALGSASITNAEVLCRISQSDTSSTMGVTVRGTTSHYYFQTVSPNVEVGKRTGGVNATLATTAKTITASTAYWMRFRAVNNSGGTACNLYARMWQDGTAEPSTWDITVTGDTSILTAGAVGLKAKMSGASAIGFYDSFTATDASVIDSVSMRVLLRTQVTKSVGLRTRVKTQQAKSITMRVRATIRHTVSAVLRATVRTKTSKSIPLKTVLRTQNTRSAQLRVLTSSNGQIKNLPLRVRARTQKAQSVGLRVHAIHYVPEVVQISTYARDGVGVTHVRDGKDISTYRRDGIVAMHARDGEISTFARDGMVVAYARTDD